MTPAVLGAAAGAAAVTIGRGAAVALGNGLSFAAELAKAGGKPVVDSDAATKGVGGLPVDLSQRIRDLTERIRRQLAAAGLKLVQQVELVSDDLGSMSVAGNHPQQAAIERAIRDDVLLERDFARLASDYAEFAKRQTADNLPAMFSIALTAANETTTRK